MKTYPHCQDFRIIKVKTMESEGNHSRYILKDGTSLRYDGGVTATDDEGGTWYMISKSNGDMLGFCPAKYVNTSSPMYPPC